MDDIPVSSVAPAVSADALDEKNLSDGTDPASSLLVTTGDLTTITGTNFGADGFGGVTGIDINGASFVAGTTIYLSQAASVDALINASTAISADDRATLVINADGTYTFTLTDNFLLSNPTSTNPNAQTELISEALGGITVFAEDGDGDQANGGDGIALNLSVVDDIPTAFMAADADIENSVGETSVHNGFSITTSTIGADQEGASLTFDVNLEGVVVGTIGDSSDFVSLTTGGAVLNYYVSDDGLTLTASTSTSEVNVDVDNTAYTVEIDGDATNGFTYDVNLFSVVDNGSGFVANPGNVTIEGGNTPYNIITFTGVDAVTAPEILVTGYLSDSIPDSNTAASGSINTSSFTWGVANQTLSTGQQLVLDYGEFTGDGTGSYTYDESISVQGQTVTFAKGKSGAQATFYAISPEIIDSTNTGNTNSGLVSLDSFSVTDNQGNTVSIDATDTSNQFSLDGRELTYVFSDLDGDTATYESVSIANIDNQAGGQGNGDSVAIFGEQSYGRLVVENDGIEFGLTSFGFNSFDSGENISITIDVLLTDGDGDSVGQDFEITFLADADDALVAPIAIDIDEDGSAALAEDTTFAQTLLFDQPITEDSSNSEPGETAESTQLASQEPSGEVLVTELVVDFLVTNPVEEDLTAQVQQEVMDSDLASNITNSDTLADESSYANEEYEDDLDLDLAESTDMMIAYLIDETPIDAGADNYASLALA